MEIIVKFVENVSLIFVQIKTVRSILYLLTHDIAPSVEADQLSLIMIS